MNFKEYDKIIKEHKFDMLHLIIYYNLRCNELSKDLSDEDMKVIISFVYDCYLDDENHIDLGHMCDKALEFKEEILKDDPDEFDTDDLLMECDVIV